MERVTPSLWMSGTWKLQKWCSQEISSTVCEIYCKINPPLHRCLMILRSKSTFLVIGFLIWLWSFRDHLVTDSEGGFIRFKRLKIHSYAYNHIKDLRLRKSTISVIDYREGGLQKLLVSFFPTLKSVMKFDDLGLNITAAVPVNLLLCGLLSSYQWVLQFA